MRTRNHPWQKLMELLLFHASCQQMLTNTLSSKHATWLVAVARFPARTKPGAEIQVKRKRGSVTSVLWGLSGVAACTSLAAPAMHKPTRANSNPAPNIPCKNLLQTSTDSSFFGPSPLKPEPHNCQHSQTLHQGTRKSSRGPEANSIPTHPHWPGLGFRVT